MLKLQSQAVRSYVQVKFYLQTKWGDWSTQYYKDVWQRHVFNRYYLYVFSHGAAINRYSSVSPFTMQTLKSYNRHSLLINLYQ